MSAKLEKIMFLNEHKLKEQICEIGRRVYNKGFAAAKDCNTILLANHGTITFGPTLEKAYWNSEIIDAYCNILILSRQLGRVNYFSAGQTRELLDFKKKLGYDDPRLRMDNVDMCGNSVFDRGYSDFVPKPVAFAKEEGARCGGTCPTTQAEVKDVDELVRIVTDKVMAALATSGA